MKPIDLGMVADIATKLGRIVISVCATGAAYKMLSETSANIVKCSDYDDAIGAITDSDMYSGDKTRAIAMVKRHEEETYYAAIVRIMSDKSTYSGDKLRMIQRISSEQ